MSLLNWQELLVDKPPGIEIKINTSPLTPVAMGGAGWIQPFSIEEFCDNQNCTGFRIFRHSEITNVPAQYPLALLLKLKCSNCNIFTRYYSVLVHGNFLNTDNSWVKIGQYPAFGPPLPSRLSTLIGSDRDLFFKGYRSEKLGFGVGAFAYYRQVVENQKGRFIGKIVEVAEREGVEEAILQRLRRAATETQFSASLDLMKDSVPPKLLIHGHNPLALLHRALSQGLHNWSDDVCLELATDIREILSKLAEQISVALADDARVREAITRLNNFNPGKSQG